MNFLKSFAQYILTQSFVDIEEVVERKSSGNWEIINQENIKQYQKEEGQQELVRDPTRYYVIENEFFDHVVVQKDQKLRILTEEDWKKIITNKSIENVCHKNLIFSIFKGIPKEIRKQFWTILANVQGMRKKFNVDYYTLLENKNTKSRQIIEKDVPRTKVAPRHKDKLFNILLAYSNLDPSGYTQGMNLICGSLLTILSSRLEQDLQDFQYQLDQIGFEQKVLWMFVGIMYGKNWRQCFDQMKGLKRMLLQLQQLMVKYVPKIFDHIVNSDLDLNMCFAQYYLTLIIYNTPLEFATIILDLFLLEGQKVIHSVILKMLIACEEKILKIEKMDDLIKFFKSGMLEYCHMETKKQCKEAQSLNDFLINFFTLTTQ